MFQGLQRKFFWAHCSKLKRSSSRPGAKEQRLLTLPRETLAARNRPEVLEHTNSITIPRFVRGSALGSCAESCAQGWCSANLAHERCEQLDVAWIAQKQTILTVDDDFARSGCAACDNRQATCHRFQDGKPVRIFERWTEVRVGGGIKLQHVFGRLEEIHSSAEAKLLTEL